ncbi:MAG TPA: hypothetical protein PKH73_02175, partial [Candidatus Pacearchaeota archaeon]|nr:hypothetical protein [Candidatus Pacearchaeota archaeon]HQD89287.1 hypothetical protein [Candidatus Pacearchaeota archaeon]
MIQDEIERLRRARIRLEAAFKTKIVLEESVEEALRQEVDLLEKMAEKVENKTGKKNGQTESQLKETPEQQ